MNIPDLLHLALQPFRTRAVESLLIILAVALGTAVVISAVALLLANSREQTELRDGLGSRIVTLQPQAANIPALIANTVLSIGGGQETAIRLSEADLPRAQLASPAVQAGFAAEYAILDPTATPVLPVLRVTSGYARTLDLQVQAGGDFTDQELKQSSHVILLSTTAARRLFPGRSAVGQRLVVQGAAPFEVIGVFDPPRSLPQPYFQFGETQNAAVGIVPFASTRPAPSPRQLYFLPNMGQVQEAVQELNAFAAQHWAGGVAATTNDEVARSAIASAQAQAWIIAVFAAGGIVIAAVNLANLMLSRVLGRTRTIIIMRALGASQRVVFIQYMAEVLALSVVGCLLGLLISVGFIQVMNQVWGQDPTHFFVLQFHWPTLFLGLLASLLFCSLYGAYPAVLASRVGSSAASRA